MKKLFVVVLCIFASAALSAKPDKKAAEKAVTSFLESVKKVIFRKPADLLRAVLMLRINMRRLYL